MQFGNLTLKRCRYGWMLFPIGRIYVGKCLELYGQYSEGEVALMRMLLRAGDTVIDIGANIGALTVPMSQLVGEKGHVYAIESDAETFNVLCANLALNGIVNTKPINSFVADGIPVTPGSPAIAFVDSSEDESKLVVLVGSDVDPGNYYLFDKATKQLAPIMAVREELVGAKLSTMKPITFPAADGTMIPGYITLPPGSDGKNLPAIVMPHGGPAARDEWGFDWLVQYFASQGYAVLQPNYRGSTGYGAQWFQKNGYQSWRTAIADINDAGRWLVKEGISTPDKLAIVGWSYGGYSALQSQVLEPDLFKAVVAVAPVTDLDKLKEEARRSSDYRIVENYIGTGPHIDAGSPARHADRFKAPVLLFHGDLDLNVGVDESRLMNSRLQAAGKSVEYVEFKDLDHQLDNGDARIRLLSSTDRFLRKALGIK